MAEFKDTLQLTTEENAKQGIHELEVSFGGELDLHKHFDRCSKNPGHVDFIPASEFCPQDIPEENRTPFNHAQIKYLANLTVKVSVRYVSQNRPKGYVLSDRAGQNVLSVGSGYFSHMIEDETKNRFPCPINKCSKSTEPHDVFGYFSIFTAAHVVFDDLEAENTCVEFFYDDPKDKSRVKKAEGVKVVTKSVEGDFTELLCVTHDESLVKDITCLSEGYADDATFCNEMLLAQTLFSILSYNAIEKLVLYFTPKRLLNMIRLGNYFQSDFSDEFKLESDSDYAAIINKEYKMILSDTLDGLETYVKNHFGSFVWIYVPEWSQSLDTEELIETMVLLHKFDMILDFLQKMDVKLHLIIWNWLQTTLDLILRNKYSRYTIERPNHLQLCFKDSDFKNNSLDPGVLCPKGEDKPLVVTISHPHGQTKQITIGDLISCDTSNGFYSHIYSCSTCNGSSGAPVWIIPSMKEKGVSEVYGVLHKGPHGNKVNEGSATAWAVYPPSFDWQRQCSHYKQQSVYPLSFDWLHQCIFCNAMRNTHNFLATYLCAVIAKNLRDTHHLLAA